MIQRLTWDALRALNLVGRDIVQNDMGRHARGPIATVVTDGRIIKFRLRWFAELMNLVAIARDHAAPRWVAFETCGTCGVWDFVTVDPETAGAPILREDGSIVLSVPYSGGYTILPEGDRLDPASVEGLPTQSPA